MSFYYYQTFAAIRINFKQFNIFLTIGTCPHARRISRMLEKMLLVFNVQSGWRASTRKAGILSLRNKTMRLKKGNSLLPPRRASHEGLLWRELFPVKQAFNRSNNRVIAKDDENDDAKGRIKLPLPLKSWFLSVSTFFLWIQDLVPWSHFHFRNNNWVF